MSYRYEDHADWLATADGRDAIVATIKNAMTLLPASGAATMSKLMTTGDTWKAMAAVDWLVEADWLRDMTRGLAVAGQDRTFAKGRSWPKAPR